jgi:NADPH2:quinone reductase
VLVRHEAVGLNFIDTYHRSGLYKLPLPSGLGGEAAGTVEAVGEDVAGFREGNRVGYFTGPLGSYATHRTIAADRLVKLPDSIGAEDAAAMMLKGCTAEYLVERCARVEAGQTVLVHAAAGGMGSILVQWLKAVGARVIAHAGDSRSAPITPCAARWTRWRRRSEP